MPGESEPPARPRGQGTVRVACRTFGAFLIQGLATSRTYLVDCLVGLFTYPAELALAVLMWRLFLTGAAGPMSGTDVVTYYAILLLVARLGPSRHVSLKLESEVVNGGLVVFMVRPTVPWAALAGRELAPTCINFVVLTPLAAAVVALVAGRLPHVLAFTGFVALAVLLRTLIRLLVGTASFWMHRIVGLVHAVELVLGLASGGVLPLSYFPGWVRALLNATPMPLLAYVPIQAMTGSLPAGESLRLAAVGLLWAFLLTAVFLALWSRGVRRFAGHGV